jgi:hypothetical protein
MALTLGWLCVCECDAMAPLLLRHSQAYQLSLLT